MVSCSRAHPADERMGHPARTVATKPLSKIVALVVILSAPVLLLLAAAYNILSPRGWAIGMLTWFAILFSWAIVLKLKAKKTPASSPEPATVLDGDTRRRLLRRIWVRKTWIGALAILFPIGIVNGTVHHAWLPTLTGAGMSLLFMYVAVKDIRKSRKRLASTRE